MKLAIIACPCHATHMEEASGDIAGLYERHARAWDRERGRSLFEKPWLDQFLRLIPSGAWILDLGCGAAEPIARYVIERGHEVTGVDASPTLIDIATTRFPRQQWLVGDMRDLALGCRFAGILAWDSFFHLTPDDQRQMFGIFERHATAGAALMFTSGPAHGVAMGSYQGDPLYHASLDSSEYRSLLDEHGFAIIAHLAEDPSCGGHTVWLAQCR
jgi:predicted TPR repeat methyltransferase